MNNDAQVVHQKPQPTTAHISNPYNILFVKMEINPLELVFMADRHNDRMSNTIEVYLYQYNYISLIAVNRKI